MVKSEQEIGEIRSRVFHPIRNILRQGTEWYETE